ncbi:MAG: exo-alpha-sialidase [Pirellulales bacterium]|nr:exo-alpha-sialidase [Pirellulales bacterium]
MPQHVNDSCKSDSILPPFVARRILLIIFTVLIEIYIPGPNTVAKAQAPPSGMLRSPYPQRIIQRGNLKITLGEIRMVMRGPMFPLLARVSDMSIMITAARAEEQGQVRSIRSDDLGRTWRSYEPRVARGAALNTIRLADGRVLSIYYDTKPIAERPGYRSTTRWLSEDGWKTMQGPLTDGTVYLPPDEFKIANSQWFHGNTIQLPGGELLSAMQGVDKDGSGIYPFHTFVARSADNGKTWLFLSRIASLGNIDDPQRRTKQGWHLHGPCEHTLAYLGGNRLISVARIVNDDRTSPMSEASDTYRDLSYTIPGSGIHPDSRYPADKFYTPGPRSAPLVISYSQDLGKTWSRPKPMREACGCAPRSAVSKISSKDGKQTDVIALSYGALAFPRWGNCIKFSTDGGHIWTDEINYAPFFSTGYTDILQLTPGKFLCTFDCTPPQPWTAHATHWVGVLDIEVEVEAHK